MSAAFKYKQTKISVSLKTSTLFYCSRWYKLAPYFVGDFLINYLLFHLKRSANHPHRSDVVMKDLVHCLWTLAVTIVLS